MLEQAQMSRTLRRTSESSGGRRPDAIDFQNGQVRELKPGNARAISRGEKQLERYLDELRRLYPDKNWGGKVIPY